MFVVVTNEKYVQPTLHNLLFFSERFLNKSTNVSSLDFVQCSPLISVKLTKLILLMAYNGIAIYKIDGIFNSKYPLLTAEIVVFI